MEHSKKEDLLSLFTISLALVATSVLIYMSRTPGLTGNTALNSVAAATNVIYLLILVAITVIIGAIVSVHNLHKEVETHKRIIARGKEVIMEHPNMELVQYVMNARRAGIQDKEIIKKLKEEGWRKEDIKKYL